MICNDRLICKRLESSIYEKFRFEIETVGDEKKALEVIEKSPWQYDVVVIYDNLKRKLSSIEIIKEIKENYPEMEMISVIASREKDDFASLHEFAFGCFFLPINYMSITYAVKFAREHAQSRRERKMLEKLQELSVAINSATELQEIQNLTCKAAVEILDADHSALVLFEKDLSKGIIIAEYPGGNFMGTIIKIKGIPAEERLVYNQEIINVPNLANYKILGKVQKTLMKIGICSVLIVPVILNSKAIASFSLDMIRKNRVFYQDEIELCKKLANQVAVAIGKARYLNELSVINKIGQALSYVTPWDLNVFEMLSNVRKHAGTLLDVTNFYIALYDAENDEYSFPYHDDKKDDIASIKPEQLRTTLTDYVRRTKKPILANAGKIEELMRKGEIQLIGSPALIWLGAPLISKGKVLGVMVVQNYENENAYDEHDLTVLETIASQTAIAIDNAQLFRDAQRRIRDMEIVDNIVRTISNKLDTQALFETMVTQIAEKLNYKTLKVLIAAAFLQENNFEKAKSIYSEDLHNADSAYSMGLILFKEGKFEQSIDILKAAFAKNPYIVKLLTGNMGVNRGPSFGILLTDYGVACNYVEMNFKSWDAVDGALAFLRALFAHPLLNNDIQALSGILTSLDRETDHQRKTQLEKSKSPIISRITSKSSREIWKDLSE